jgi:hypothetical protein
MKYCKALIAVIFFVTSAKADAQQPKEFNDYILRSIAEVVSQRKNGGYDLHQSFTQDLRYGNAIVKASKPSLTMCVAAIEEIIIEAINLYAKENGPDVFDKIPVTSWSKGHLAGLRANIFTYKGTGSRGTGHALDRFGVGKELPFSELKAGDFVNFNRANGTGHAVVFLGYLDKTSEIQNVYSDDIVGFRYFSAQGKGRPDAGLGYRNAYFSGLCPASSPIKGFTRDCDLIRASNRVLLNSGRMYAPAEWKYDEAVAAIRAGIRSAFENAYPGETRGFIDKLADLELNREVQPEFESEDHFNGVTTD